jgi:hypothetical protein
MKTIEDIQLEDYLMFGSIHIAGDNGFLFTAGFRGPNVDYISVQSDRGFDHLFLLIASAILADDEIKDFADNKYKYPLTISSTCELERALRHEYIEIFKFEELVRVRLKAVSSLNGTGDVPGLVSREGTGATISEAITNALATKPQKM